MKHILTFSLFAFTFSFFAHATPSWAVLNTGAYSDKDTTPSSANGGYYSAYYCTIAQAELMFGASSVDGITSYLSANFSDGKSALTTTGTGMNQAVDYGLGQYTLTAYFADAIASGDYLAVALYNDGVNEAFRVFGSDSLEAVGGNLAFDDLSGGTASAWTATSAVPEPTSGLLMLLGLAGIALKRRRVFCF